MTALPLQRIEGKYEILEKIREGGMGAIYKVRHRLLDEIRVIKLMRQQLVDDEELKARFLREARLAIKLRHPNIAQLYDFTVDDDGNAYIVMELINGLTLEDLLARHGPPPLGLALEIAHQSLKALGYLHMKSFVHRDISPDNLMLAMDMEGQPLVKLIDLGIAKTLEVRSESPLTQTGTFLGKIRYASPEQFGAEGAATVDSRGDLYSFGIVLYELLTARFPIQGRDSSSIIAGHLFRPPLEFAESDAAGRVPEGLRAVVLKALAKSPADRFANAAELSRALAVSRAAYEIPEGALHRLLAPSPVSAEVSALPDAGSTQGRLDQHFELAATPSPGSLLHLTESRTSSPATPAGVNEAEPGVQGGTIEFPLRRLDEQRNLAATLAEIETALANGSYRSAETLLYAAEAIFGAREELALLHERLAEVEAARRRERTERKQPEQQIARDVKKIQARLDRGDLDGAEALLDRPPLDPDPFAALRKRLGLLRREARRAQALAAAVAEIGEYLDRNQQATAEGLLDIAVVRFGAAEPLREQWERLERMRAAGKAEAARRRQLEEEANRDFSEAARQISDLLSHRQPQQALQELRKATARFGERGELLELRKRIASLLLDD